MKQHIRLQGMPFNVAITGAAQLFSAGVGIVTMPLFLSYFGSAQYGTVALLFFIQSVGVLLDFGMGPTAARRISASLSQQDNELALGQLNLFSLIAIGVTLALFGATWALSAGAHNFATHIDHQRSIQAGVEVYFVIIVGFRWLTQLHRAFLIGLEKHKGAAASEMMFSVLRHPLCLAISRETNSSVELFLAFQVVICGCEAVWYRRFVLRCLLGKHVSLRRGWHACKSDYRFTLFMGCSGVLWTLISQADRLVLSKVIALEQFGYYSFIAAFCSGLTLLAGPLTRVITPRLTNLANRQDREQLGRTYRSASRALASGAFSLCMLATLSPRSILWAWTGSEVATEWASNYFAIFVWAAALQVVGSFSVCLAVAHGQVGSQVMYNFIVVACLLPLAFWTTSTYGISALGWLLVLNGLASLLLWTPVVHKRFTNGIHFEWLSVDVLFPALIALICMASWSRVLLLLPATRIETLTSAGISATVCAGICFGASNWLAKRIRVRAEV